MFVLLVLLWLFREPKFIPGWGDWFRSEDGKRQVVHRLSWFFEEVMTMYFTVVDDSYFL